MNMESVWRTRRRGGGVPSQPKSPEHVLWPQMPHWQETPKPARQVAAWSNYSNPSPGHSNPSLPQAELKEKKGLQGATVPKAFENVVSESVLDMGGGGGLHHQAKGGATDAAHDVAGRRLGLHHLHAPHQTITSNLLGLLALSANNNCLEHGVRDGGLSCQERSRECLIGTCSLLDSSNCHKSFNRVRGFQSESLGWR